MNMKWKLLQGGLILLMCNLLTTAEEKEKNIEGYVPKDEVRVPPQALRHLAAATATNHSNDNATGGPEERVKLPWMGCSENKDCQEYNSALGLICFEGQCSCPPPQCWVYAYIITGTFTAINEFTCGECGVLGSSCNGTIQCDFPGECWSDGYCHCPKGENYDGVCLSSNLSWANSLAFAAMGIVFFMAICIMGINCFKQPPCRNQEIWGCRCCHSFVGGTQRRRGSCEKTPAFTIQAHYASQDLACPQEDVQEAPPNSHGGAVPRRPRAQSTNSGTISSFSSANTNTTTMSESVSGDSTTCTPPHSPPPLTFPPPPSPPPPPPPLSLSDQVLPSPLTPLPSTSLLTSFSLASTSGTQHNQSSPAPPLPPSYLPLRQDSLNSRDSSSVQLSETLPEESNLQPSTLKSSSEVASESSGVSGSCQHERCQLCLPRPPASSISAPPRRKPMNRCNNDGKRPLLPQPDASLAETTLELTQL